MSFNQADRNIIRGGPGSSSQLNYDIYAELLCNMAIKATQPLDHKIKIHIIKKALLPLVFLVLGGAEKLASWRR
jgi:hypothetical protein